MPVLWKHITKPIQFTLTVDDFGVKYEGKEHADHLIDAFSTNYAIKQDWEGALTAESPSNGTTHKDTWIYPCQHTLTSSSPDLNTNLPQNHNIAHAAPHHDNLGILIKIQWITTCPHRYYLTESNKFNKLWAQSCTTHGQLILPS